MDNYQLTAGFQKIQTLLDLSNKLIQKLEPWKLFKERNVDEKKIESLNVTLNYLINGIKTIVFLLKPVAPESSRIIFECLNLENKDCNWENVQDFNRLSGKKIELLKKPLFIPFQ